ncbi:MAG: DUF3789 domain-containing protein [Clostridia bacterium]|nr:DUF3789 domain-containing protein [Clostridia bacterium]
MLLLMIGLSVGTFIGIAVMCMLQIGKSK